MNLVKTLVLDIHNLYLAELTRPTAEVGQTIGCWDCRRQKALRGWIVGACSQIAIHSMACEMRSICPIDDCCYATG